MRLISIRCIDFYMEYVQLWVLNGSYEGIFGGGIAPLPQQEQVAQSRFISEIAAFGLTKNQIKKRLDCLSIPVRVTIEVAHKWINEAIYELFIFHIKPFCSLFVLCLFFVCSLFAGKPVKHCFSYLYSC